MHRTDAIKRNLIDRYNEDVKPRKYTIRVGWVGETEVIIRFTRFALRRNEYLIRQTDNVDLLKAEKYYHHVETLLKTFPPVIESILTVRNVNIDYVEMVMEWARRYTIKLDNAEVDNPKWIFFINWANEFTSPVFIRRSSIPGANWGLFANFEIAPRSILAGYGGHYFDDEEDLRETGDEDSPYLLELESGEILDMATHFDIGDMGRWANTQVEMQKNNARFVEEDPQIYIESTKEIPKYTEVFVDYGLMYRGDLWLKLGKPENTLTPEEIDEYMQKKDVENAEKEKRTAPQETRAERYEKRARLQCIQCRIRPAKWREADNAHLMYCSSQCQHRFYSAQYK